MTYSSSVALSRRSYARRNQNAVSFRNQEKALGPVSNTIILLVLACIVGLLYLTQVTRTNSYGYTINSLQQQQSQLQDQRSNLEVNAARLQSLARVSASQVAKNMVQATPSGVISQ
jgi:predicted histidine transporter YuiF (NhaC family)